MKKECFEEDWMKDSGNSWLESYWARCVQLAAFNANDRTDVKEASIHNRLCKRTRRIGSLLHTVSSSDGPNESIFCSWKNEENLKQLENERSLPKAEHVSQLPSNPNIAKSKEVNLIPIFGTGMIDGILGGILNSFSSQIGTQVNHAAQDYTENNGRNFINESVINSKVTKKSWKDFLEEESRDRDVYSVNFKAGSSGRIGIRFEIVNFKIVVKELLYESDGATSIAQKCGLIQVGDILLQVNAIKLSGLDEQYLLDVLQQLQSLPEGTEIRLIFAYKTIKINMSKPMYGSSETLIEVSDTAISTNCHSSPESKSMFSLSQLSLPDQKANSGANVGVVTSENIQILIRRKHLYPIAARTKNSEHDSSIVKASLPPRNSLCGLWQPSTVSLAIDEYYSNSILRELAEEIFEWRPYLYLPFIQNQYYNAMSRDCLEYIYSPCIRTTPDTAIYQYNTSNSWDYIRQKLMKRYESAVKRVGNYARWHRLVLEYMKQVVTEYLMVMEEGQSNGLGNHSESIEEEEKDIESHHLNIRNMFHSKVSPRSKMVESNLIFHDNDPHFNCQSFASTLFNSITKDFIFRLDSISHDSIQPFLMDHLQTLRHMRNSSFDIHNNPRSVQTGIEMSLPPEHITYGILYGLTVTASQCTLTTPFADIGSNWIDILSQWIVLFNPERLVRSLRTNPNDISFKSTLRYYRQSKEAPCLVYYHHHSTSSRDIRSYLVLVCELVTLYGVLRINPRILCKLPNIGKRDLINPVDRIDPIPSIEKPHTDFMIKEFASNLFESSNLEWIWNWDWELHDHHNTDAILQNLQSFQNSKRNHASDSQVDQSETSTSHQNGNTSIAMNHATMASNSFDKESDAVTVESPREITSFEKNPSSYFEFSCLPLTVSLLNWNEVIDTPDDSFVLPFIKRYKEFIHQDFLLMLALKEKMQLSAQCILETIQNDREYLLAKNIVRQLLQYMQPDDPSVPSPTADMTNRSIFFKIFHKLCNNFGEITFGLFVGLMNDPIIDSQFGIELISYWHPFIPGWYLKKLFSLGPHPWQMIILSDGDEKNLKGYCDVLSHSILQAFEGRGEKLRLFADNTICECFQLNLLLYHKGLQSNRLQHWNTMQILLNHLTRFGSVDGVDGPPIWELSSESALILIDYCNEHKYWHGVNRLLPIVLNTLNSQTNGKPECISNGNNLEQIRIAQHLLHVTHEMMTFFIHDHFCKALNELINDKSIDNVGSSSSDQTIHQALLHYDLLMKVICRDDIPVIANQDGVTSSDDKYCWMRKLTSNSSEYEQLVGQQLVNIIVSDSLLPRLLSEKKFHAFIDEFIQVLLKSYPLNRVLSYASELFSQRIFENEQFSMSCCQQIYFHINHLSII